MIIYFLEDGDFY